jgi:hypothetical protein
MQQRNDEAHRAAGFSINEMIAAGYLVRVFERPKSGIYHTIATADGEIFYKLETGQRDTDFRMEPPCYVKHRRR